MVPAFAVNRLCRYLGVLVVAQHDVGTASPDFAHFIVRVVAVDFDFHAGGGHATGTRTVHFPVGIGNNRGALCGTITNGEIEANLVEELLNLAVEGCTSDDDFVEAAAKGFDQLLTHLFQNLLVDNRCAQEHLHADGREFREYRFTNNLLDNQGHGDDDVRTNFGEGLEDDFGRRHTCEVVDVHAMEKFKDKLKGHAVGVGHGEH